MVSRTPRNQSQSQPRSTRAAARPAQSFEAWENVNDNVRSHHSMDQRRAKSSIRYQSTSRSAHSRTARPGQPRMENPQRVAPSGGSAVRPRAVSASRVRNAQSMPIQQAHNSMGTIHLEDDPNEVTRHILDLRERRESSSHHKRKESPMKMRPAAAAPPGAGGSSAVNIHPSSPKGRVLEKSGSNMSQEEIQAEERLKRAESKISGLLDDLEELKFFQELESDETPANAPTTPSNKHAASSTPRNNPGVSSTPRNNPGVSSTPRNNPVPAIVRAPSVGRERTPLGARDRTPNPQAHGLDKAPGRDMTPSRTAGIPLNIRAPSPARAGRLPPPPPTNTAPKPTPPPNKAAGGLETYKPLSPRAIAKLDRNSLELECQTLVRKMQLIDQERNSQAAMIEMYEISLQEHDMDKAKIQKLESELGKVSGELKRQLQNLTKGKESLVKDYEAKLQQNLAKLHRVQEKSDSFKAELDARKSDSDRSKQEMEQIRSKVKEEKARADDLKARESTLELQLTEARNLNATLVKKVEKKRTEVTSLQNDLSQTNQQLRDDKVERDQAYETRIQELQRDLAASHDKCARLRNDVKDLDERNSSKENQLDMAQVKEAEQTGLIEELQGRVNELQKETVAKFEEGKKLSKTQETRRLQELVAERATQTQDYERRLKAMQEQLRHQADRHHAEIQETRTRNDERLEAMREELREELRIQEGEKMASMETELSVLRRNYDEAKGDFTNRLKEAQQKSRDAAADFQRQEEVRQQELDHMHGRLESYVEDVTEKENEIESLNNRVEDTRKNFELMKENHSRLMAELMEKDDVLAEEREKSKIRQSELETRLETTKSDFTERETNLQNDANDLRNQLQDTRKSLAEAQEVAKESEIIKKKLQEIQTAFDTVQEGLKTERTQHEEVEGELRLELAKLEGKLRASESSLKLKKSQVQELETQLDVANTTSSKVGEERQSEIKSLRSRLEETATTLEVERLSVQEKEADLIQMEEKVDSLQQRLKEMSNLEDVVREMKRQVSQIEYEGSQKDNELAALKRTYEETRSKLAQAELRFTESKTEFETRHGKREKMVERYEKSMKDLEFQLEQSRISKEELQSSLDGYKKTVDSIEMEKIRKDTELFNLRKDYEELSLLLEDNLHSSAKKEELDKQLKRQEREMQETVDGFKRKLSDAEERLKKQEVDKTTLEAKAKGLGDSLKDVEEEKARLSSELSELRQKFESSSSEFELFKQQQEKTKGGIELELGRKDRHMRDAVQRYMRTIADLEAQLEEEAQTKTEMEDRLSSARSELEDKQRQTQELIQKHTKGAMKIEADLNKSTTEVADLKAKLEQTSKELENKRKELKETVGKYASEVSELQAVQHEHNEYKQMSEATRAELEKKNMEILELKRKIPELTADLKASSREIDEHKATVKRQEAELGKRKAQYNQAVTRYTDEISDLEARLEEHSYARSSTEDKVESVKAESSRKDKKIRELEGTLSELESKLDVASKAKEAVTQKMDNITRELDEKDGEVRQFEMEKIELETKLHTQLRSKEELRTKTSELSSKLERKEREVREVTDRYKMYIMELESKLDQDTDAKHDMQREIDRLKNELSSAFEVSSEASELREKVHSLERTVGSYRGKARDAEYKSKDSLRTLEDKLADAVKEREDTDETLKKVQGEKAEVIAALEGVINEVQNREDEIASLSDLLQRRDEELQHAKIIATKALQSAKDIQRRYKDKDNIVQSDVVEKIEDLTDKNETLQRTNSTLARDLKDRDLECRRLKDQLRQIDGNQLQVQRDHMKDDGSAFTQSTFGSSRVDSYPTPASSGSGSGRGLTINAGGMEPDGMGMSADSFSPTNSRSPRSPMTGFGQDDMFSQQEDFTQFDRESSIASGDDRAASTIVTSDVTDRWNTDFDSGSHAGSGFDSYASEPQSSSRRSIERDALRKYVRQRYMAKR